MIEVLLRKSSMKMQTGAFTLPNLLSALPESLSRQRSRQTFYTDPKAVAEKNKQVNLLFLGERPNPYLYESELSLRLFMVCGE